MILPKAKLENIVVNTLKDEVLIYDLTTNQAVCLNSTSANVFNACDGVTTFDQLKAKYNYTDEIIYLALDGLKKEDLLEEGGNYVSPFVGMNRRDVIRKVGLASMIALPVISAMIAPHPAHAASQSCGTQVGACIPAGTNLCPAGCANRQITSTGYTANSGCTGAVQLNNTFACPANGSGAVSAFDRKITDVT